MKRICHTIQRASIKSIQKAIVFSSHAVLVTIIVVIAVAMAHVRANPNNGAAG